MVAARGSGVDAFAVRGRLLLEAPEDKTTRADSDGLVAGAVIVEGGKIAEVVTEPERAALPARVESAAVVAPGFVDLQINGGFGVEVAEGQAAMRHLARQLPSVGVTGFLPTLVSSDAATYAHAIDAFEQLEAHNGARALGLHAEGPFIAPARRGAHLAQAIERAGNDVLELFLAHPSVRLVTVAPEVANHLEVIAMLRRHGTVVSLGHTDASYEQFVRGVDCGATLATHLYNAMSALHHRAPGAVGAALAEPRVSVSVIADGVHCHPASLRIALRCKGPEHIVLVSDAIAGAGLGPGQYELQGQTIYVADGEARLEDGTLAGSTLTMERAVQNMIRLGGATTAEALRMASTNPARVLGVPSLGSLAVGQEADIVLLDHRLDVTSTFVGGQIVYHRDRKGGSALGFGPAARKLAPSPSA